MVIQIADYVKHYSNNKEGKIIFNIIKGLFVFLGIGNKKSLTDKTSKAF